MRLYVNDVVAASLHSSEHRDTEAFESVVEDEQLPQVVDELHDLYLSPGAPSAKMSVRVKGQMCRVCFLVWLEWWSH